MRKTLLAILPAFALGLVFSGCGDNSTSSAPPALTSQDRQALASLPAQLPGQMASLDAYMESATSLAKGFADAFKPTAARASVATCDAGAFDTTMTMEGMTISMKVTKADGTTFGSCTEAANAYLSADGIGMQMTMVMAMNQQGVTMNMNMSYDMVYKPVVATGGYTLAMTMTMNSTTVANGQTTSMSIDPMTMTMTASSRTAVPTMTGSMTMGYNGMSISNLRFDQNGAVTPQTVDILKEGSKVAILNLSASGQGTVTDLNGNVIQG